MPDTSVNEKSLQNVIDRLIQLGKERGEVTVGEVQQAIGQRSFGPFLFIPAIIELSPIGGIPGVPTFLALIVAVFALQILLGRKHFWMPAWIRRCSLSGHKLESGLNRIKPAVRWLDRVIRPRLHWASRPAFVRVLAALCLLLITSVPPLELVPFASSVPFGAIALFGLGITARDGLVIVLGLLLALGAPVAVAMGLAGG